MVNREARLVHIIEGQKLSEPDGWHVVAIVDSYHDPRGHTTVLVVQERCVYDAAE